MRALQLGRPYCIVQRACTKNGLKHYLFTLTDLEDVINIVGEVAYLERCAGLVFSTFCIAYNKSWL